MTPVALGVFGKLPAVGDFVHRGLSRDLAGALDRLTQTALQAAVAECSGWHVLERQAQSCVLCIRPGSLADSGFVGCMVPSCDRVGRFFPLFAGLEFGPRTDGGPSLTHGWIPLDFAVQLCRVAYTAQAEKQGPDQLVESLPAMAQWPQGLSIGQPFATDEDTTLPALSPSEAQLAFEGPESRMQALDRALCSRLPLMSELLGSVITQGTHFDLFFATRSLLSWSSLAALFDQRWVHWGWDLVCAATISDEDDATLHPPADDAMGEVAC